jgi:hypothetical protein
MLEESRRILNAREAEEQMKNFEKLPVASSVMEDETSVVYAEISETEQPENQHIPFENDVVVARGQQKPSGDANADPFSNRKPISEVLHDIYDNKAS